MAYFLEIIARLRNDIKFQLRLETKETAIQDEKNDSNFVVPVRDACDRSRLTTEFMPATPQVITSAMQLYFTGESFRNVQRYMKCKGQRNDY